MTPPEPAAASVWQPPQPLLAKTWAPGAAGHARRRRAGDAGVGADVGGDVVEVLPGDDVARHRDRWIAVVGPRVLDLGLDDPFDRLPALAGGAGGGEGVVEVGPDLGRGPGLGEGVADAAFLHEEGAPAGPSALVVPQPEAATTMAARAARASSGRMSFEGLCIRLAAGRSLYVEAA